MFNIENNREILKSQIPLKPYATNDLDFGLTIQNKNKALDMLYLQVNHPLYLHTMIFDLDKENCFYEFENAHLPIPSFITKSPDSGRCHYGYMLNAPISSTEKSRQKPVKFARALYYNMATRLGADLGYAGLITKNPLNDHWSPFWSGADLYDLDYLADFVDLEKPQIQEKKSEAYGLGRNVNLFEDLRQYAYRTVLNFKKISTFEKFENELLLKAQSLNTFCNPLNPLQYKELKATARSIARWTWKNFDSHTFSLIQSSRGAKNKNKPKKSNVKEMLGFIGGEK